MEFTVLSHKVISQYCEMFGVSLNLKTSGIQKMILRICWPISSVPLKMGHKKRNYHKLGVVRRLIREWGHVHLRPLAYFPIRWSKITLKTPCTMSTYCPYNTIEKKKNGTVCKSNNTEHIPTVNVHRSSQLTEDCFKKININKYSKI